jgi:hypothetical protein
VVGREEVVVVAQNKNKLAKVEKETRKGMWG